MRATRKSALVAATLALGPIAIACDDDNTGEDDELENDIDDGVDELEDEIDDGIDEVDEELDGDVDVSDPGDDG